MKLRRISNDRCFLIGKGCTEDLPWANHRAFFFASGREALVALIKALNLKNGDVVLLPSYVPEGVIAPCQIQKLDVHFYKLDLNLDPDWEYLDNLIKVIHPKLAVLIHYFGVRRDASRFTDICHRYSILVIEDLAHSQTLVESSLGSEGDFTLYSLTKIVGVPDGAVLQMAPNHILTLQPTRYVDLRRAIYILMNIGYIAVSSASRRFGSPNFWRIFFAVFGRLFGSYRFLMWYFKNPTPMSCISRALLNRFPWRSAISKRLGHEKLYQNMLNSTVFKHLTHSEENHCSMGYAVLVKNREMLNETLTSYGVFGIWFENKWDFFPAEDIHEDAKWVMKNHFLFPTAYSLSVEEIKRVIQLANEWAATQIV